MNEHSGDVNIFHIAPCVVDKSECVLVKKMWILAQGKEDFSNNQRCQTALQSIS